MSILEALRIGFIELIFTIASLFLPFANPIPSSQQAPVVIPAVVTESPQATTSLAIATSTATSTVPKQSPPPPPPPLPPPPPPTASVVLPPAPPTIPASDINTLARAATVNILCTATYGSGVSSITASGIIIDPKGVVLTNAHVAQYFLLEDYPTPGSVDCIIRDGSPAVNHYDAELLYISPEWIRENAESVNAQVALGTGENDFALLLINKNVRVGEPLPATFSALPFITADEEIAGGEATLLSAYPAGFLGGATVFRNLNLTTTLANVSKLFTFGDGTLDLISIGGNVLAQKGSSGGAVVATKNAKLIGLIVTSTDAETTDARDLRAITLSHIARSLAKSSGTDLAGMLRGDLKTQAAAFQLTTAPTLKKLLTDVIEKAL